MPPLYSGSPNSAIELVLVVASWARARYDMTKGPVPAAPRLATRKRRRHMNLCLSDECIEPAACHHLAQGETRRINILDQTASPASPSRACDRFVMQTA